ncbi:NADPH:quinone oxidoreductase [Chromatiales bacterium (ex Bugula neritina AB1)]|nr:NADPH:quinone oxidoreductase [Chromatiales bacterium (ex Bugula neritina AB1)]
MKAVLLEEFGGAEKLYLGDIPKPAPASGQVLIKVAATSVNRPDIIQRQGNYPPPKGDSEIIGLEVAGTIESVADEVTGFKAGDRVFALVGGGGYAEYAVAYADHVMRIPENLSFQQAACICETYITAYLNTFVLGKPESDDFILLHGGGGGVNTAALQLCQVLLPDARTIVTASTHKVDRVRQLGADHVIDYKTQSFAEEVKTITGGKGANVILDHIGAAYLADNMKSLAVAGRLVVIGIMGGIKAELNIALMMVKRQQILGSVLRSRPVAEKAAIIADFNSTVMPHFASEKITPLISNEYPLEEVAEAHRAMENGEHFGKIVLML